VSHASAPPGHGPFAVWNRTGNRAVAALLRSPLHRVLSGRLLLITVTGRRSARRITLPVTYTQQASRLTIHVMWPERKLWWRNLRDGAPVGLRLRGRQLEGWARAEVDPSGATRVEVELGARP
jgi:F420H(2)-dependent quinone reductase